MLAIDLLRWLIKFGLFSDILIAEFSIIQYFMNISKSQIFPALLFYRRQYHNHSHIQFIQQFVY